MGKMACFKINILYICVVSWLHNKTFNNFNCRISINILQHGKQFHHPA